MKIGYIAVGTELLWENKFDSNKNELAKVLLKYGLEIDKELIIKDKIEDLIKGIDFLKNSDLIIISGGLGPTKDDITREGLSKYFKSKLQLNENLWKKFKLNYEKKGLKIKEISKNQFFFPSCSMPLENEKGTAPGIFIEKNNKAILAFPGVPEEFKFMLSKHLEPFLKKKKLKKIFKRTYNFSGTYESYVEDKLKYIYEKFPSRKITILASFGIVSIKIKEEDKNIFKKMDEEIKRIFKDELFSIGEKRLNECIYDLLLSRKKTISVAESCTGGGLCYELVKVPGISKYFKGGVVVYSNEAKEKTLNVSKSALLNFGAVSLEVAKEMAENVRKKFKTDIGVSITGIAGPEGGSKQKPVGTVYIGISSEKFKNVQKFQFTGSRERIQRFTINFSLDIIRKVLL